MKRAIRAVLYGKRDIRLEELILCEGLLEPQEIYVETEVTAMSTGTELGNYLGDSTYVPGAPGYPRTLGYSNVGTIREIAAETDGLAVGQRVFSQRPHQSAYLSRSPELLVAVPDGVPSERASLCYLTQLGLATLQQARYKPGEHVAVVGLGVIGLSTVALARALGAKVAAIANSWERAEAAIDLGADIALSAPDSDLKPKMMECFGEAGADIVVLTANAWEAYFLSLEIARFGGRVGILGFPGRGQGVPSQNPLDPKWLYAKQLTVMGSGKSSRLECRPEDLRFNLRRNLAYVLDLMAADKLPLERLITHRLEPERMQEAYKLAEQHSKDLIAAVFDWRTL